MEHTLKRNTSGNTYAQSIAKLVLVTAGLLAASVAAASVAHADVASTTVTSVAASTTDTTALITWMTNEPATSQVIYGTSTPYTASTTLDMGLVMSHSKTINGLMANTLYHFAVLSSTASSTATTSIDQMFVTKHAASMATSSATTTPPAVATTSATSTTEDLRSQIALLWEQVHALQNLIALLQTWVHTGMPGTGDMGSTTPPTAGLGMIDQNGWTGRAGGSIDFGGRHFGHEETVLVTQGATTVASAHADGGGNFSTGSLRLPTTAGTYTYSFRGQNSGIIGTAIVTLQLYVRASKGVGEVSNDQTRHVCGASAW